MLTEKYQEMGFEITQFGRSSTALRRNTKVLFVFNPGIHEDPRFVESLCACYVKIYGISSTAPVLAAFCAAI